MIQTALRILDASFFGRDALEVAPELIGKVLVCVRGDRGQRAVITEAEAYVGPEDKACHAHRGLTERTRVLFGPPGHWYVYLCYGMHWMLNIVAREEGFAAAVLIRSVVVFDGFSEKLLLQGPGKLTRSLQIDKRFNGMPATEETGLWMEDCGITVPCAEVRRTPRIGVGYAGTWANKPYRFVWPMAYKSSEATTKYTNTLKTS